MNYKNISKQSGWTFWSLMFVLGVLGFFGYVGMQLIPVYGANNNVKNAMRLSLENIDSNRITRASVIRSMDGQLYLDGSHKLLNYKTDLVIKRSRKLLFLETHYQREIPLFYNLSILVKFDNVEKVQIESSS